VSLLKSVVHSISVSDVSEGTVFTVLTFSLTRHDGTVKKKSFGKSLIFFSLRHMALFFEPNPTFHFLSSLCDRAESDQKRRRSS